MKRAKGSILVGLLWCLALLSVVVLGVLHTARMDLLVVKNYGDRIQAHYLALAGVEKAKALIYQDASQRSQSSQNHSGDLYNDPEDFRDAVLGRGTFQVFRPGRVDEGDGIVYGVDDEESRLNLNQATSAQLTNLFGITPDVVAAIIDWRDPDDNVTLGGAEADYYLSLQPPRLPRNGPFQTVRELLLVRGVSRELLLGRRAAQNPGHGGMGDGPGESAAPADPSDVEQTGWASLLTVDSSVNNVNAAGDDRVNAQTADESGLTTVPGITSDIARAIVAYRDQNQFKSLADLLDVTAAANQNQANALGNGNSRGGQASSGASASGNNNGGQGSQGGSNPGGPKMISTALLMEVADDLTVDSGQDLPGAINLNTASLPVLICLPGVDRQIAKAIIDYRQSAGFFPNVAHLLKVEGVTPDIFKQVAPLVSARSETYRILSEGRVTSSGARQRIEAVVHIGLKDLTTLAWREDDL